MANNFMNRKATGVWMGVRRCGCPVAVATDYGDDAPREFKTHINKTKREFLKDGLSVVYATWDEWIAIHSPKFLLDCEHVRASKQEPSVVAGTASLLAAVDPHVPT